MNKIISTALFGIFVLNACNNAQKDSVEIADSTNKANIDTALNRNTTVIDEYSAEFLVTTANSGMAELDMAAMATQMAASQRVKNFGSMLVHDHGALNEQVKILAAEKKTVLPAIIGAEKQKEIDELRSKTGRDFDRAFTRIMVKGHEESVKRFEKALTEAKIGRASCRERM